MRRHVSGFSFKARGSSSGLALHAFFPRARREAPLNHAPYIFTNVVHDGFEGELGKVVVHRGTRFEDFRRDKCRHFLRTGEGSSIALPEPFAVVKIL